MSQNIEIEYKALLTKEQFIKIKTDLPFPPNPVRQTNYYFETAHFDLKNNNSALRIRKKDENYQLTLKQQQDEQILETHDSLNYSDFQAWTEGHPVFKQHTKQILQSINITENKLIYFGYLTTNRWQFFKNDVLYCLDESFYNNNVDYELEIEEESRHRAKSIFHKLVKTYHLEQAASIPKIQRFFNTL